jgi:hypothetical protein
MESSDSSTAGSEIETMRREARRFSSVRQVLRVIV